MPYPLRTRLNLWAAVALLAFLTLTGCERSGPPLEPSPTPPEASPIRADFKAGATRALDAGDRPEANAKALADQARILAFLNNYYNHAFVDPSLWAGGTHPGLAPLFSAEAQASVARDIEALALGALAGRIRRVEPTRQEATRISVLIEPDLGSAFAAVSTRFEGRATPAGRGTEVPVVHEANFMLAAEGDGFRIWSYSARIEAGEARAQASHTPAPAGAGAP